MQRLMVCRRVLGCSLVVYRSFVPAHGIPPSRLRRATPLFSKGGLWCGAVVRDGRVTEPPLRGYVWYPGGAEMGCGGSRWCVGAVPQSASPPASLTQGSLRLADGLRKVGGDLAHERPLAGGQGALGSGYGGQEADCVAGHAFSGSGEAQVFLGGGLYVDLAGGQMQILGDVFHHLRDIGL